MANEIQQLVWAEKHRPATIDETILPESIKKIAKGLVAEWTGQSIILDGSRGIGKTTLAYALASELNADVMFINASLENSIDMIRSRMVAFASTVSLSGNIKITILDECDGIPEIGQKALRGFIEEFSGNHSIIFTCNFLNKIIEPIHSRCKIIKFAVTVKEKPELTKQFLKRVFSILDSEKVTYSREAVASLVMKKFPDFRSILNELQGYAAGGNIDAGILSSMSDEKFEELIKAIKEKKFSVCRKWVAENIDIDSETLYRTFYNKASDYMESKSLPELILHLGEYSYRDYFVADKEISRCAFIITVMTGNITWK